MKPVHDKDGKRHGKGRLVKELVAIGFSYRTASKAVDGVFYSMAHALRKGESVEIPGGKIQCRRNKRKERWTFVSLTNIRTGKRAPRVAHFKPQAKRIEFRPDHGLDLTPLASSAQQESSEERDIRDLVLEQIGHYPTDGDLKFLLSAIQQPDVKMTRLLNRLHSIKERGWKCRWISELVSAVRQLWSI